MSAFDELIGRDHAAGVLRAQIDRAVASHGGLVLVTGEAGIGKTTLVTSAAREARRRGAWVFGGACWESGSAPGYWPWVQVVRALRRAASPGEWAAAREAAGGGTGRALSVLLGEPAGGGPTGGGPGAPGGDAGKGATAEDAGHGPAADDSFQVYDAVTTLLVSASHHRPVVVVLEDLHWADADSLHLLRFAAQHAWFERLLLVGTYREAEGAESDVEARLAAKATTVSLTGLDVAGVAALMARAGGRDPGPELAAEVHRRSGGNPFFVEQTARLWHSRGHRPEALAAIPPGVRDTVRRRLSLLPRPVATLLTGAAVLGREFHRRLLAATEGVPSAEADRTLDQAVAARLVTPLGAGRFAFAHDLVRETLYEDHRERDPAGARRRHAAVVRALDGQPGLADRVDALPAELARHGLLAGDALPPERVLALLRDAAADALGRMAFAESVGHLRRAYEVAGAVSPRERVRAGLLLVQELHHAGADEAVRAEALPLFREVADEARRLEDPELLARVALSLFRTTFWVGTEAADRELTARLLREAGAALGEEPTPAAPSDGTPSDGAPSDGATEDDALNELAHRLTIRSAVLARRGADDEALAFSLAARHDAVWGTGTAAEREALTAEMIAVARRTDNRELEHFAMSLRWVALLELGDARYLEQFREFVTVVELLGVPRFQFSAAVDQCIIATLQGRFEEAELHQRRVEGLAGREEGRRGHHAQEEQYAYFGIHLRWAMLLLQGRFGELDELLADPATTRRYHRAELIAGITAACRGDTATVLRLHEQIRARGGARDDPFPRSMRPLWLRFQALAAAASRDPALCERARSALAPYAAEGLWAVSMWGFDVSGPMVLWVAVVDAAQERWDAAVEGFTAAARTAEALGARPWSVEARARLARALLARDGPGDADAAASLRGEVAREAAALGMRHLVAGAGARAVAATVPAEGTVGRPGPLPGPEGGPVQGRDRDPRPDRERQAEPRPAANEFRFDGAVWTLRYAGRTVHVPDAKGLRDLHQLLGAPGADIAAADLAAVDGTSRRMGGDPVLDEEAKARYRRHLARLDEEIDQATGVGEDERAARLDTERAALLAELRAAAGLAGRTRRLGDEAERARKTVTARIRDTLRRLDDRHPELAAHLRATVTTGTHCAYRPTPQEPPRWRL
ncbi:ATP-binding protein [Streptomyces sp. 4N509B]|uniref:ATP-binding protein n=1 Tax=Streptomyces sp. 4N509B TaxID=3457413 RepID=UPI003FD33DF0